MNMAIKPSHAERVLAVAADSSASARSAVAASWNRSMQRYGLDPRHSRPPARVSNEALSEAQDRIGAMARAAQAALDSLFMAVGGTGCCVMFTDRSGILLDRRGAAGDMETFNRWGMCIGSVWNEENEGTNGIGTCLAEERALTIHREQHFFTRNTGLSCSAAPVYDHQGRLAAALDVSSCRADHTEAFVGLIGIAVAEAARRIEVQNFRMAFPEARVVMTPDLDRHSGALLAVDTDDLIVGATRAARLAYGLTNARLATPLPADTILGNGCDRRAELKRAERGALHRALAATGGNVSAAAKALGISRATLHRKMNRLEMHTEH